MPLVARVECDLGKSFSNTFKLILSHSPGRTSVNCLNDFIKGNTMSWTQVDQRRSSSSIRRSSLVVNLSTTRNHSSTSRLFSSNNRGDGKRSVDEVDKFTKDLNGSFVVRHRTRIVSPHSAPPLFTQPSYGCPYEASQLDLEQSPLIHGELDVKIKKTNPRTTLQVIEAQEDESPGSPNDQLEGAPEPIIELKNSSSSSLASGSDLDNSPEACGGSEGKLVRKRTIRRLHRSSQDQLGSPEPKVELENTSESPVSSKLIVSLNSSPNFGNPSSATTNTSQYRTRQTGSFHAAQATCKDQQNYQQQTKTSTLSSSSKIAKCSITTNRSSSSRSSSSSSSSRKSIIRQLISESSSSSSKLAKNTELSSSRSMSHSIRRNSDRNNVNQESLIPPFVGSINLSSDSRAEASASHASVALSEEKQQLNDNQLGGLHSRFSSSSRQAAMSSSSSANVSSRRLGASISSDISSLSTSRRRFRESTSSMIVSGHRTGTNQIFKRRDSDFMPDTEAASSPDVVSLAKEIGIDFAELETFALSSRTGSHRADTTNSRGTSLSERLFSRRALSPSSYTNSIWPRSESPAIVEVHPEDLHSFDGRPPARYESKISHRKSSQSDQSSGDRIKKLMARASSQEENNGDNHQPVSVFRTLRASPENSDQTIGNQSEQLATLHSGPLNQQSQYKAGINESIERIDQRMSDLCKKLNDCQNTKEVVDILKIMIQIIEKAWSVPVCGDDLGFRLCNSLRQAGGLDILLGLIQEDANRQVDPGYSYDGSMQTDNWSAVKTGLQSSESDDRQTVLHSNKPLKLNLTKVINSDGKNQACLTDSEITTMKHRSGLTKDSNSDVRTSDLGLDSASIESLCSAPASIDAEHHMVDLEDQSEGETTVRQEEPSDQKTDDKSDLTPITSKETSTDVARENEEAQLHRDELVFLCARLLSQCLTSDNRDHIVANGLQPVIKLACKFATMKSFQMQRLLSRSAILRKSSSVQLPTVNKHQQSNTADYSSSKSVTEENPSTESKKNCDLKLEELSGKASSGFAQAESSSMVLSVPKLVEDNSLATDQNEVHTLIGTEILQHLFKHSEDTCYKMISLGALEAILYGCRSSNIETLRQCASALANLALYGGPDSQQTMILAKAHVWLFPLAFNEDDNVQYYACLAIVVLVANQEIEADVLKSSTLNLVEPFVTSHQPQKFAESTTTHIHGQSPIWLRKLIPLLESKREEARNLACFHFAMEAYIKREQGQTKVFHEIGAVEPLRKVGSSPIAIAARFACQALRLIGEKEPHKLSQQVPLWTREDVVEWVSQIGFEVFKSAFVESQVDGDLLLQLDEAMLREDIRIDNGIIRRRFLRELSNLKLIADYSSVDRSGLSSVLGSMDQDYIQYIYPMVQLGVTKDNIHLIDCEQIIRECNVTNSIHRIRLSKAIQKLQEASKAAALDESNSDNGLDQKSLDVFVSYRRSTGSQLASLLKVHLQLRGFSVFIDVERLEAGKFDNNLLDSIKSARNFILVLSPNALDRCIGDHECKDWVHKEIVAALASNCNIIPIMDNFIWPEAEQLPEDMRSISYFNGVLWIHDYQDACVDKVERFIRGEFNNAAGPNGSSLIGSQSVCGSQVPGSAQPNIQRYASSTPSMVASPSLAAFSSISTATNYSSSSVSADYHPLSIANQYKQNSSSQAQTRRLNC